jgi:hypothetical protein
MWEDSVREVETFFRHIYDRLDAVKLLLTASKQTVYGDFKERIILTDLELTMRYIRTARRRGYRIRRLSKEELYIVILGQYSGFFEILLQGKKLSEALKYVRTYGLFCTGGWKALLIPGGSKEKEE